MSLILCLRHLFFSTFLSLLQLFINLYFSLFLRCVAEAEALYGPEDDRTIEFIRHLADLYFGDPPLLIPLRTLLNLLL